MTFSKLFFDKVLGLQVGQVASAHGFENFGKVLHLMEHEGKPRLWERQVLMRLQTPRRICPGIPAGSMTPRKAGTEWTSLWFLLFQFLTVINQFLIPILFRDRNILSLHYVS